MLNITLAGVLLGLVAVLFLLVVIRKAFSKSAPEARGLVHYLALAGVTIIALVMLWILFGHALLRAALQ